MNEKKLNRSDTKTVTLREKQNGLETEDLEEIKARGCIISGNIGCGKTVIAKSIFAEFANEIKDKKSSDLNLRVFDVVGNWRRFYPKSQMVDDYTVKVDLDVINVLILRMSTKDERLRVMEAIAKSDFVEQQDCWYDNGIMPEKSYVYIVEESNTIFTTQSINKGFWLDFVAFARNYKVVGVYIMQRLSDSSTKVIERIPNFIFGKTRGQNDKRKIKAMLPSKEARNAFENLKKHEFLCLIGDKTFILEIPENYAHYTTDYSLGIKTEWKIPKDMQKPIRHKRK